MAHPPAVDVRRLVAQLKLVKDQHIYDEALRKQLCDAVRDVALAKETPKESVERIFYAVSRLSSKPRSLSIGGARFADDPLQHNSLCN